MAYISLANLLTRLKGRVRITSDEGFTDTDLKEHLVDASALHNAAYSLSDSASTVPAKEAMAVVYLAWASLLRVKASRLAQQPNQSGASGFGSDRSTPFHKCMELADKLVEKDYKSFCQSLGLTTFFGQFGSPEVTEISSTSQDSLGSLPTLASNPMPVPVLGESDENVVSGSFKFTWDFPRDIPNFHRFRVFRLVGSSSIYQTWNHESKVYPLIHDDAVEVSLGLFPQRLGIKVSGLTDTSGTVNRFIVVAESKSGLASYSSELIITQD